MRLVIVAALVALSSHQAELVQAGQSLNGAIIEGLGLGAQTCSNGVEGFDANGVVCCPLTCGGCAGSACASMPGGYSECCGGGIKASGVLCSESGTAPCVIEADQTTDDAPTTPAPSSAAAVEGAQTCSNGVEGFDANGVVCCRLTCGGCAGSACASMPGGYSECCGGGIKASGVLCSESGTAPCIIEAEPTLAPATPAPSEKGPSEPSPSTPSPTPTSNPSPTPLMTIPTTCDSSTPISEFSFDSEEGTTGTYWCFTLTDLYTHQGGPGPLYVLDDNDDVDLNPAGFTGKWLLTSGLYAIGGGTFHCRGSGLEGGDCDELRIESTGPDAFHRVSGYGGNLYFESTLVTSWDTENKEPQTTYEGGRSYINCISESIIGDATCANNDMGECRMDIINSEMGYLGWPDDESYGISLKVKGLCSDLSNMELFEDVNVYGDMQGSDIHHNYYGHFSFGHQGGVWTDNLMHDNIEYGFDPHDDSDYLTISGNTVYNNGNHGIIASKRCNNVLITNNHVYDGGEGAHGIMLHRSSDYGEISNNLIENMQACGIAIMESFNIEISGNTVDGAQYGIRMTTGSSDNMVYENSFDGISKAGIYLYTGGETPEVGDGRLRDNEFFDNEFAVDYRAVKLTNCDDTVVTGNTFTGSSKVEFTDAKDTIWSDNSLSSGSCILDESTFAGSSELPAGC